MRLVIQRVINADVEVDGIVTGKIGSGLLVLVGVERGDTEEDCRWLAAKTVGLRVFNDESGVMNRSVRDVGGQILAVSQFTLTASTRKGNRPSYMRAAGHEESIHLYDLFVDETSRLTGTSTHTGVFGADMKVRLTNDGPVTIIIDSRLRE